MEIKWYNFLNVEKEHSLFRRYPRSTIGEKMIISQITQNGYNRFAVFKTYLHFESYQQTIPKHQRTFFEIILGEKTQKPHFDIDIDLKKHPEITSIIAEDIKDHVVEGIVRVLEDKNIFIDLKKDVLIFTSHGPMKKSYHIVVDNYSNLNYKESEEFFNNTMIHVPHEYHPFVDEKVYKSLQQFRIVGSQKLRSNRPKTFQKVWNFYGCEIKNVLKSQNRLSASLISVSSYCTLIPSLLCLTPKKTYEFSSVSEKEAYECLELLNKITNTKNVYKIRDVIDGMILLQRLKPDKCLICNRYHEHENPYILVINRDVLFCCRRDPENRKIKLGTLSNSQPKQNVVQTSISVQDSTIVPKDDVNLQVNIKYDDLKQLTTRNIFGVSDAVLYSDSIEVPQPISIFRDAIKCFDFDDNS